jgi:PAS domain-containing protein
MPFGLRYLVWWRLREVLSDPGPFFQYGIAVLAVLVATVLRLALNPVLGVHAPYLLFALAVMFAARFGGLWSGLFATALSMLSVTWFFLKPIYSFRIPDAAAGWGLVLAFVTAVLISLIVGDLRESLQRTARAEESLRDSEGQSRTLADAIPQLCWMADTDGEIFWYNERAYEHSGATLQQLKGWGWQSLLGPEVRTEVVKRWQHSLTTGEPFDMVFPLCGVRRLLPSLPDTDNAGARSRRPRRSLVRHRH